MPETVLLPPNSPVATVPNGKTGHAKTSTAFSQAKRLQELLFNDAEKVDIKPLERSSVARVWAELEECKRKLKMKPLPGSLRPTSAKPQRKVKDRAEFTSSVVPPPTPSVPPADSQPPTPQEQK